jgi:hypothetical protein
LTGSGLLDMAMVEKSEIVSDVSEGTPVKCAKGVVYPGCPEPIQRAAPGARTALYIRTSPTGTDLEKVRSSDVRNLVCVLTQLWKGPRDPECTVVRQNLRATDLRVACTRLIVPAS